MDKDTEIKKLQARVVDAEERLAKSLGKQGDLNYVISNYQICFEGALGAIQHLNRLVETDMETVQYYAGIALHYLSMQYNERRKEPNKYKEALKDVRELANTPNCEGHEEQKFEQIVDICNEVLQ